MDGRNQFNRTVYTQRVFHRIMNAFAHPFQIYSIADGSGGDPLTQGEGAVIKDVCCVFLDNTVSFHVHGEGAERAAAEIRELTYAKLAPLEGADFVIIRDPGAFGRWGGIHPGSLLNPHEGATVIVEIPQIRGSMVLKAAGPGIDGEKDFPVSESLAECLRDTSALHWEYPEGFELLFVTGQGELCAVPRHIKTRGEGPPWHM